MIPDERLWEIEERYRGSFGVEPLSYGTVRDLADSRDHFAGLARASGDMKDLQRCWMVKAVLGTVERGGRLVEIGAGEPLVADLLSRLGHEVTLIDPYDGSGNGPLEFERFRRAYPDVELRPRALPAVRGAPVRDRLRLLDLGPRAHPARANRRGCRRPRGTRSLPAAARSTQSTTFWPAGAPSLTSSGWRRSSGRSGLSEDELDRTLERLREDPDAYFVSAEAHESWRGALPYDEYPMRRIASIGLIGRP